MHAAISFERDSGDSVTAESLLKPHALGAVSTSAIGNSEPKTIAEIDEASKDAVQSAVDAVNVQIDEHSPTLTVNFY